MRAFGAIALALTASACGGGAYTNTAGLGAFPNLRQPVFTRPGAPVCDTEYGLLQYSRRLVAGNAQAPEQYGCAVIPEGKVIAVVTNVKGINAEVVFQMPDGSRSDFVWTPMLTMRN